MVSLDDAVVARWEYGGKRYEVLLSPELVEAFREDPDSVSLDDLMAVEDVFHDARQGERPTVDDVVATFGTEDMGTVTRTILERGSIQLTTAQRKARVETMRQRIIHRIHSEAVDPRSKSPHPKARLELALEESRFSVDPFKRLEAQVKDAIAVLKPLIPLSFERIKLAFKVSGAAYGRAHQLLRGDLRREEWLGDGSWVGVVDVPAARKADLIGEIMRLDREAEVKELPS
ncbi:MAG: ribosome assembly factor SBDS [Euryarchaeota archaeon TMED141]|nr:MAG: ribosome assembly factor SBDS [Euryarchaeota archaeon TMED141]DAC09749.1 MAG TPA: ribosome assembly factor SBDS [Candidatus Poseidoniales archaeon]HII18739.1 ribosome assembly factor SBDS [Candidatus Poseidoniaceae archaeon]